MRGWRPSLRRSPQGPLPGRSSIVLVPGVQPCSRRARSRFISCPPSARGRRSRVARAQIDSAPRRVAAFFAQRPDNRRQLVDLHMDNVDGQGAVLCPSGCPCSGRPRCGRSLALERSEEAVTPSSSWPSSPDRCARMRRFSKSSSRSAGTVQGAVSPEALAGKSHKARRLQSTAVDTLTLCLYLFRGTSAAESRS